MLIVTKNRLDNIIKKIEDKFGKVDVVQRTSVSAVCISGNKEYDIVCHGSINPLLRYDKIVYDETISEKELEGYENMGITIDDVPYEFIKLSELLK